MADSIKSARFEKLFRAGGVKFKQVEAFGSQVIVTCWSREAAEKVARLLQLGSFTVRGVVESVDYNAKNEGTCLTPTTHHVWRVGAYA